MEETSSTTPRLVGKEVCCTVAKVLRVGSIVKMDESDRYSSIGEVSDLDRPKDGTSNVCDDSMTTADMTVVISTS